MLLTNLLFPFAGKLLFPNRCVFCGKILSPWQRSICSTCKAKAATQASERLEDDCLVTCRTALRYEGVVRENLLRYKFYGNTGNAPTYAALLAECLMNSRYERVDFVTWVPVSRRRKRSRGFDQAELLARLVAKELKLPAKATLKKVVHNRAQSSIHDAKKRKNNVHNVYRTRDADLNGKRILLIDDIVTTGATLSECRDVLRAAGAKAVFCAALATPPAEH